MFDTSIPWTGDPAERIVISLDIGNTYSSVCIVHLEFGKAPVIRSVTRYPPGLASSRTPSACAYDKQDMPQAFGGDVFLPYNVDRARVQQWTSVTGYKAQVLQIPKEEASGYKGMKGKLMRKPRSISSTSTTLSIPSSPSTNSLISTSPSTISLLRPTTPESLMEAHQATRRHSDASSSPDFNIALTSDGAVSNGKKLIEHHGPKLLVIYADVMKHLIASARIWFGETVQDGIEIFDRLWDTSVFLFAHPADWGEPETLLITQAMLKGRILSDGFHPSRLYFLKEPAATVYFARHHVREPASKWLAPGTSFAACDAAELGTSVIGYTVATLVPLLKLRSFEPVSRLAEGAGSVTRAFHAYIKKRLAKTKFKGAEHAALMVEQFEKKIKCKFSGPGDNFELRFGTDGSDSGAKITNGRISVSGVDIEEVFKPTVEAIIVRLSSVVGRGAAGYILLSGGFGESPYLQRRLREKFDPQGVKLVISDIPSHTAVSEGAARFYLAHQVQPRPLQSSIGCSTAFERSKAPKAKGNEFCSISGKKFVLGKWAEIVPKGHIFSPDQEVRKSFHTKFVLGTDQPPLLTIGLWSHTEERPPSESEKRVHWMTDGQGASLPEYEEVCEVSAELNTLVSHLPAFGKSRSPKGVEIPGWVIIEVEVVVYLGPMCLEACICWIEDGVERRSAPGAIPRHFF